MPNIFASDNSLNTGILSPIVGPGAGVGSPEPQLTPEQQSALSQKIFNTKYNENRGIPWYQGLADTVAGSAIDLGDTLASSVYAATPMGIAQTAFGQSRAIERGDLWNLVGDYGGPIGNELKSYYERNTGKIEVLSGVGGAIATGVLAGELLLPRISSALADSTIISGSKLWQLGANANTATRAAMVNTQMEAAGQATAFEMWKGAGLKYIGNKALRGVGKAAFEEAAIGVTMNQNQAVWSDDMSDNILWAGIGLSIGGLVGGIGARYEMRRLANDPAMVKLRQDAVDPQGFTALREHTPLASSIQQLNDNAALHAKESANYTALMLEARQSAPANADAKTLGLFNQISTQAETQAVASMQKIAVKGIPGVANSKFSVKADSALNARNHLLQAGHDDPMGLFGLDSMGVTRNMTVEEGPNPLGALLKQREELINNLKASNDPAEIRLGRQYESQQALYMVNKRWLSAHSPDALEFSRFEPGQIKLKQVAPQVQEYTFNSAHNRNIAIGDKFRIRRGTARSGDIHNFQMAEIPQVYESMRALFSRMKAAGASHQIPKNPAWFQLDAAVEFQKRGGEVIWGNGINSVDDAMKRSLKLKAAEILNSNAKLGTDWDRIRWNLPLPTATERIYDGAGDTMRAVLLAALQDADLGTLKQMRNTLMDMHGFDVQKPDIRLDGDMFNFNLDRDGRWMTPVVGFFDNSAISKPLNQIAVATANAELKAQRIITMTIAHEGSTGVVPELVNRVINSPDFQNSLSIRHLSADQITGSGGFVSQATGEFVTREMRFRDNPAMLSALRVRELTNRAVDAYIDDLGTSLADHIKRLSSAPNAASKTLVNQFFSNASGWDIKEVMPHGEDKFGFILAKTDHNASRLNRAVEDDEFLVNPRTDSPIVVDKLGLSYIEDFNRVSRRILSDVNRVRISRGLNPIKTKAYYVPPPDTRGKFVGFTFDEDNVLVPGGAIVTRTKEEFERLREAKFKDPRFQKGWTFRTREDVAQFGDLYDRAAMDWIDPGTGYRPAKSQQGTLSSDTVNPHAIEDTLDWIRRQGEQIGTDTIRVLYDSQLGIARARSAIERSAAGLKPDSPIRTVWDEYEATLLGWNLADTQHSLSGVRMRKIEALVDKGLAASWPAMKWMSPSQLSIWGSDLLQRMGVKSHGSARSFSELADKLGPYTPFQSAADYAEQTFKVVRPPEIRKISSKINRLSAAMILRYFEFAGMPMMNMLGVITNMPSIIKSGRAPIMATFNGGRRERVGIIDSYKLMAQGMRDLWHADRQADRLFAARSGDMTQQVAAFNDHMSAIHDRSSWNRAFFGDKSIPIKNTKDRTSVKDWKDYLANKGVDGMISLATDTTENMSRSWAHMVGLRLADLQGITGMEARHNFAREIANATIANYNPLNRPEFYQSAFGSMVGLFMSYMQAFNQRLFRWMETKDYDLIGHQLAMQSGLFGIASVPGFNVLQSTLLGFGAGKTEQGDDATLMDHIYARFGPTFGSAIAHGGLSQLGVALYTRGDMNYRSPTLDPTKFMAGVGVINSAVSAVLEAAQTMFDSNSLAGNDRLAEILARNIPNRVMKGVLEHYALDGMSIDAHGQIVSDNKNFFESALRMAGIRSTAQQGRIEAFYANKQLQAREAARMDVLRNETRALIRNNKHWQDSIQTVFNKYLDTGGRPEHFRTWIKDQIRSSTTRRDVNDLVRAMRNPKNQVDVWRYQTYSSD